MTTVHCDRCGQTITRDRTLLRVESGPLLKLLRDRSTDLCRECCGLLLVWLENSPHNTHSSANNRHDFDVQA